MDKFFQRALPIWADGYGETMNVTCLFQARFPRAKRAILRMTACNVYRVFVNGKFTGYGPARAPHGFFRVDEYELCASEEENLICVEVAGYNCNSFYAINQTPFLQAELDCDGKIYATGDGGEFSCRIDRRRIRKSPRYSYQRAFCECYDYTFSERYLPVRVTIMGGGVLLPRGVSYPLFNETDATFAEFGGFTEDLDLPVYRNRCLTQESIGLYPLNELECDPNIKLSRAVFARKNERFRGQLNDGEYAVFDLGRVVSGFIGLELEVKSECETYIVFDEADGNAERENRDMPMDIAYDRNDSLNFVYCGFGAGEHRMLTFEPYSMRYVKLIVFGGSVEVRRVFVTLYENPDAEKFEFTCGDKELESIVRAAKETFAHNAVDLPTDCPGRERAGWLCDAFFISRAEKLFTGENRVERNFLENYFLASPRGLPNGMIGMCWPADFEDGNYIPNWAMWYVLELKDYVARSGDCETAAKSESTVRGLLGFFEKYENSCGLLENLDGWVFVEWSAAGEDDYVKGVSFPTNMLYASMLDAAADLYGYNDAAAKAERVRKAVRRLSYNGEFFEDNRIRVNGELESLGHVSETCQYYAFFTNTATLETYPELWQKLVAEFGPLRDESTVYPNVCKSAAFIGNFLRMSLLTENHCGPRVLQECKSYFAPMAKRTGTLWEHGELCASLDHGFASYAANIVIAALTEKES